MRFAVAVIIAITSSGASKATALDVWPQIPKLRFVLGDETVTSKSIGDSTESRPDLTVQPRIRIHMNSDEDRRASYASAGLSFPFGEFDLGRPRSILQGGPLPAGAPGVPRTLRPIVEEAALNETLGAGLRLESAQGRVSFGTSVHSVEKSSLSIVGLAGRYDTDALSTFDNIAVYGGAETDGQEERFQLGTEVTRGIATAGINITRSNENDGRTLSQIYLGVDVSPSISLGISGLRDSDDASATTDTRFGLGASLSTVGGAYFQGGVDGVTSEDPAIGVSIGFQF